jgi:hypothetical protein
MPGEGIRMPFAYILSTSTSGLSKWLCGLRPHPALLATAPFHIRQLQSAKPPLILASFRQILANSTRRDIVINYGDAAQNDRLNGPEYWLLASG